MAEFIEAIADEMIEVIVPLNHEKWYVDPVWDSMLGDNVISGTVRLFAYLTIYIVGFGTFFWWIET